jgi:hypothetical protein
MLLGLPSQMGIKVNLDLTQYISFDLMSTKYWLCYPPISETSFKNEDFESFFDTIMEFDKKLRTIIQKNLTSYYSAGNKIYLGYMNKPIFYTLRIGVYEHQSKLLREKWQSTTQQNNYKKLNIG